MDAVDTQAVSDLHQFLLIYSTRFLVDTNRCVLSKINNYYVQYAFIYNAYVVTSSHRPWTVSLDACCNLKHLLCQSQAVEILV